MVNPLFGGYKQESFENLVSQAANIYDAIYPDYSWNKLYGALTQTPMVGWVVGFGILPIVVTIIVFAIQPFIWCCIRNGNAYVKIRSKQDKLDRQRRKLLRRFKIKSTNVRQDEFNALMQAAANLPDVQQQIQAMMTEQLQVATLRSQTKAKQSWKFMWVVLYYCAAIVGLVGIIYFGKGTTDTVNYGQNAVDLAKKHENYLVGYVNKSFSSIDTVVSSLINRPSSLCSSFINKDSDKFEKELERFISDVKLFNTTQVPLQKAFDLVEGDDGLLSVLGKLLFFPSDNANQLNYVQSALLTIQSIISMMKSTDQSISNLGAATSTIVGDKPNYPKEVQTLLDQWNIQNFNVDIYSKIPVEITNTIKLLAQDPTKWAFANKIVDIVQPLISEFNLATIQKLFVPCDQNGANCQLFTIQEFLMQTFNVDITQYLDGKDLTVANLIELARGQIDYIKSPLMDAKDYFDEYKGYIDHVVKIPFAQFIEEMTKKCSYPWCGIIANGELDVFNSYKSWVVAGVYVLILLLPIAIWICQLACTAFNKSCCVSCSVWSCCCCQIFTVLLSVSLLCVSIIQPMVIKPLTTAMTSNFTQMYDQTASKVVQYTNLNIPVYLSGNNRVKFTPAQVNLNLSSVQSIIDSFKFKVEVDFEGALHDLFLYEEFDFTDAIMKFVNEMVPNKFNITLDGSNIQNIMNASVATSLGSMIHFNGTSLTQCVKNVFQLLYDDLNKLDNGSILSGLKPLLQQPFQILANQGWNRFVAPQLTKLQDLKHQISIPTEVCTAKAKVDGWNQVTANPATTFNTIDTLLNATTLEQLVAPSISASQALDQLEVLTMSNYFEFLSVHGKLETELAACGVARVDLEADTLKCIQSRLVNPVAGMNNLSSVSQTVIGASPLPINSMNDFKAFFAAYSPVDASAMIKHAKDVISGADAYDANKLIAVSDNEIQLMKNKKVCPTAFANVKPVAPTNAELIDYVLNTAKFAMYGAFLHQIQGVNVLDDATLSFGVQAQRLASMSDMLTNQFSRVFSSIQFMNNELIGLPTLSCMNSAPTTPIIDVLPANMKAVVDKLVENVAQATDTNALFNPLQAAFMNHQALTEITKFTQLITNGMIDLTFADGALINSKVFGYMPKILVDAMDVALMPVDNFSFGAYMFFIFSIAGTALLLLGYGWIAQREDQGLCRKKSILEINLVEAYTGGNGDIVVLPNKVTIV